MVFDFFQVKEFEEILLDGAEKTSFFRIPCSPLDSSKFIKQFNVWDLSEEPVLKRFIEEISKKRSDSLDLPKAFDEPSLPVSSDELHMVSPVVSPKTFKAVSFIHRGAVYPVLHVDESFLLPSSVEEHISKSIKSGETFLVPFYRHYFRFLSLLYLFIFYILSVTI